MFTKEADDRLSAWSELRKHMESSDDPLQDLIDFWAVAPFTAHNHHIDPYYQASWPTPWEIIVENVYDDFTKAIMIGWTLLLTQKYKDSKVVLKTIVDDQHNRLYNVIVVDDTWALNYFDNKIVPESNIPTLYRLENIIDGCIIN